MTCYFLFAVWVWYVSKCISDQYKPAPNVLLLFYGYYKQATVGPCYTPKPWSIDVANKAKWDAWNKLGDMSKETAMENYVNELKKVSLWNIFVRILFCCHFGWYTDMYVCLFSRCWISQHRWVTERLVSYFFCFMHSSLLK